MKKYLLITILGFLTLTLFCQDTLLEKEVSLKYVFHDVRESLPIINKEKNEVALFLLDRKAIKCFLLNKDYQLIDSITTDLPDMKFGTLLGYNANSGSYHLFFTNDTKDQFYAKTIDIDGNKSSGTLLSTTLKDERFLESISYNNKFYLLTVQKKSSILRIYVFEGDENTRIEKIDFPDYKFSNSGYTKLYDVLYATNTIPSQKIDCRNPNPLELTSQENKVYYYNDKIYITLDNNIDNTKLITISLDDFKYDVKLFTQGTIKCQDSYGIKSNSFLFQDILFQIKGCKDELYISLYNLSTDSLIKDFRVKQDEEIMFKNTPLMQEGGKTIFMDGSERELDKTKQALRKISASNIGISVYPSDENLEVTIGGYKATQRTGAGGNMTMVSPGATFNTPNGTIRTPATYFYNPTMYGFVKYVSTRSVYFKTLLDKANFSQIPGSMQKNAFDRIQEYKVINDHDITTETLFKADNYYVFGYYNQWIKKYYLIRFAD